MILATNENIAASYAKKELAKDLDDNEIAIVLHKAEKIAEIRNQKSFDEYLLINTNKFIKTKVKLYYDELYIGAHSQATLLKPFHFLVLETERRLLTLEELGEYNLANLECKQDCKELEKCDKDLGLCVTDHEAVLASQKPKYKPFRGKRVFVTSKTYTGDLVSEAKKASGIDYAGQEKAGIKAADTLCQSRANTARLGGKWAAIISDSDNNARDRLFSNKRLYLTDKRTLANSKDIWDGEPDRFISLNEFAKKEEFGKEVWTGTDISGFTQSRSKFVHCNDWTSTTGTGRAGISSSRRVVPYFNWIVYGAGAECSKARALYCFEL